VATTSPPGPFSTSPRWLFEPESELGWRSRCGARRQVFTNERRRLIQFKGVVAIATRTHAYPKTGPEHDAGRVGVGVGTSAAHAANL
jgi:hypothetical protein